MNRDHGGNRGAERRPVGHPVDAGAAPSGQQGRSNLVPTIPGQVLRRRQVERQLPPAARRDIVLSVASPMPGRQQQRDACPPGIYGNPRQKVIEVLAASRGETASHPAVDCNVHGLLTGEERAVAIIARL